MAKISQRRQTKTAYFLLAPALILLAVFSVFPLFYTIVISLFHWRIRSGPFVGAEHYLELFGSYANLGGVVVLSLLIGLSLRWASSLSSKKKFSSKKSGFILWGGRVVSLLFGIGLFILLGKVWAQGDAHFLRSLEITFWFALGTVPVQLVLGLSLALALQAKFRGKSSLRTAILLPYILPLVASAAVFTLLFSLSPQSPANQLLALFHVGPWQWLKQAQGIFASGHLPVYFSDWFSSWTAGPSLALICILVFNTWLYSGYYALVFSNGLAAIPEEVFEAAALEGVSKPQVLFRIVLPLLSPTTFFLTILGVVGTLKAFSSLYILRDASTASAVDPASVMIFFTFFREVRYGYAAALAVVLFLVILTVTNTQRRLWEKRVFYE